MLQPANRLRHYKDFKSVYAQGLHRKTAHLSLRAMHSSKQTATAASRIGISISQKVSKKAVVRNRIKRQIRAALRQMLPQILPGWDIVIIVKPSATECNYAEFLQELEQLLVKAEVIYGHTGGKLL
ncbi:MAG: ribonuclease P protein component [Microcoleaceae cyanobacterium]